MQTLGKWTSDNPDRTCPHPLFKYKVYVLFFTFAEEKIVILQKYRSVGPQFHSVRLVIHLMKRALISWIVIASLGMPAANAEYLIRGAGLQSCGHWTETMRGQSTGRQLALKSWLLGFVTGVSFINEIAKVSIAESKDNDAIVAWIENYCRQNPLDKISDAAIKLIDEFARRTKTTQ